MDAYGRIAIPYLYFIEPLVKLIKDEVVVISKKYNFQKILDLCCGLGMQCEMLNVYGFNVTGVDSSKAMVTLAKRISNGRIPYYEEDAGSTHFEDQTFDCIVISFALHEKNNIKREEILKEARRLTRHDGKVIVVDYLVPNYGYSKDDSEFWARAIKKGINIIERLAGEEHYKNYKDWLRRGALSILEESGFLIVERKQFYFGTIQLVLVEPL